jgi:cysteine-rich repeat protein
MKITKHVFSTVAALCLASPIVACSFGGSTDQSALSGSGDANGDCTLTQGYWKNHPDAWPVSKLKLGSVEYTKDQLIAILETPVKGNGLVQLSHQLIAAKLNIAAGASDVSIKASITASDALIGSLICPPVGDGTLATSVTAELNDKLDAFNSGETGPGHCGDNEGEGSGSGSGSGSDGGCDQPTCGNGVVETGEACDDGNTTSGDGCSSTCQVEEHTCVCGNGVVETGETCDDGNTTNGDGCSSTCQIELPVCGNGIVETGETCDDGNTTSGDGCSSVCICEPCTH